MQTRKIEIRKQYVRLIESESVIDGRFTEIRGLDRIGGVGHFSLVFTAKDLLTGNRVALKFYDPYERSNLERFERFKREQEMLKILANEKLVINAINDGLKTLTKLMVNPTSGIEIPLLLEYFVMELADDNVENYIYSKKVDPLSLLLHFKEMLKAVFRVHNLRICHRDLKPNNFLIIGGQIRLSDFGTAKKMDGTMPNIRELYEAPVGDRRYSAPELFLSIGIGDEYAYSADLFSLGAILFEMFANSVLTQHIYNDNFFKKIRLSRQVLMNMDTKNRIETYRYIIGDISKTLDMPDISSFNNNVPKSIKNHLNTLYQELSSIDIHHRLKSQNSIHRKIDIIIKILKNEQSYKKWLEEKRKRRENRLLKGKQREG